MATYEKMSKYVMMAVIGLTVGPMALATVSAEVYEDSVAEFFAMDSYALIEFDTHANGVTEIAVQKMGNEIAHEDAVSEYFANSGLELKTYIALDNGMIVMEVVA